MNVYVKPLPAHLSLAMYRVSDALKKYSPKDITIVEEVKDADIQVLHVIGKGSLKYLEPSKKYVVIQYCYKTSEFGATPSKWRPLWEGAELVWSYYDLEEYMPKDTPFYYSPLGIAEPFTKKIDSLKDVGIITSGYVNGPKAEAIEECASAARYYGLSTIHLGPMPIHMERPPKLWDTVNGIDDYVLAQLYSRSRWVSGLRHGEGFEFPIIEGLAQGARPIVFNREEMRHWFNDHAVFVHETSGEHLTSSIGYHMRNDPKPVSERERQEVLRKFSWASITEGFWNYLK
jgi:hypothetical protein